VPCFGLKPNWLSVVAKSGEIHAENNVLQIFSPFRIFDQLALALKNRVCPADFHCIEYTFYIQDF